MAHLKRAPDAVVAPPLLGVDLGEVADKAVGGHLVEKLLDETEDVQAGPERAGPDASHEKEKLADHYRVLDRDEREHWAFVVLDVVGCFEKNPVVLDGGGGGHAELKLHKDLASGSHDAEDIEGDGFVRVVAECIRAGVDISKLGREINVPTGQRALEAFGRKIHARSRTLGKDKLLVEAIKECNEILILVVWRHECVQHNRRHDVGVRNNVLRVHGMRPYIVAGRRAQNEWLVIIIRGVWNDNLRGYESAGHAITTELPEVSDLLGLIVAHELGRRANERGPPLQAATESKEFYRS